MAETKSTVCATVLALVSLEDYQETCGVNVDGCVTGARTSDLFEPAI